MGRLTWIHRNLSPSNSPNSWIPQSSQPTTHALAKHTINSSFTSPPSAHQSISTPAALSRAPSKSPGESIGSPNFLPRRQFMKVSVPSYISGAKKIGTGRQRILSMFLEHIWITFDNTLSKQTQSAPTSWLVIVQQSSSLLLSPCPFPTPYQANLSSTEVGWIL